MSKRVTRTFVYEKDRTFKSEETEVHYFLPQEEYEPHSVHGLDTEHKIGKTDYNKLGRPEKIRVTVTTLY